MYCSARQGEKKMILLVPVYQSESVKWYMLEISKVESQNDTLKNDTETFTNLFQ